jgi:hypothetical protein
MTLIWLSAGLPASRSAIASTLGPSVEVADGAFPPPGTSVAVATVFEHALLEQLAAVPEAGALLMLKPPGAATPPDLPTFSGPSSVVEAADMDEVVAAIRNRLQDPPTEWQAVPAAVAGGADSGWPIEPAPTGELPSPVDTAPGRRASTRRNWLASAGIVGVAALAAILVLATQGGASNTAATGFNRGRFAPGGYGLPGASGQQGTGGPDGAGGPGTGRDADGTGAGRAAQRQAFIACLQKNGVDVTTLQSGGRPRLDPSDPAIASAFRTCSSLLPGRGAGAPPNGPAGHPGGGPHST